MKLHNSLTGSTDDFTPISQTVRMYSCGPTVYNFLHIGNLSAFIYADVLRRTLVLHGYSVTHVMNITDVDDKTIRNSSIEFPELNPMAALMALTRKYTDIFKKDLALTGTATEDITFISAVDTIPEMIALIQQLLDTGIAYIAEDGVYFSISAYQSAGNTYGIFQQLDTSRSKERIANDEYDKDSVHDFALWKAQVSGEPSWPAEFTTQGAAHKIPGRPGWHIECSAMSEKLLGIPFDIHTGGIDLKFPHHENEIAQSCGAGAKEFAKFFVHNNHLLVDGRKMSKSLGNFYTLRDIESKGFDAMVFRLVVLESHYRNESNFSWDILSAARNRLHNWKTATALCWQLDSELRATEAIDAIKDALENDLDTPTAISNIDKYLLSCLQQFKKPSQEFIALAQSALGIDIHVVDISEQAKQLLAERAKARESKNWSESDTLRGKLSQQHIEVLDTPQGQLWHWANTQVR